MQKKQIQRRGKPRCLEQIRSNNNTWLFEQKCLQFFSLIQEGKHSFPYCSRKGEALTPEENQKKKRMMDVSNLLGIPTYTDKAILLYLKPEQQLRQIYNQQLNSDLYIMLQKLNAGELMQFCNLLDDQFIKELTIILYYVGNENLLSSLLLEDFHENHPSSYFQVVKNAYLTHVKKNEKYMAFHDFIRSNEAYQEVCRFIKRIHNLINKNKL